MTKRTKRIFLTLLAVYVTSGLVWQGYQSIYDYLDSKEAAQAQQEASAMASGATTFTDARRWLEGHGYRVIVWNPYVGDGFVAGEYEDHVGGPGPRLEHRIVVGEKRLRFGSRLLKPSWLDVTFQFADDGHFTRVLSEKEKFGFPTTRPTI